MDLLAPPAAPAAPTCPTAPWDEELASVWYSHHANGSSSGSTSASSASSSASPMTPSLPDFAAHASSSDLAPVPSAPTSPATRLVTLDEIDVKSLWLNPWPQSTLAPDCLTAAAEASMASVLPQGVPSEDVERILEEAEETLQSFMESQCGATTTYSLEQLMSPPSPPATPLVMGEARKAAAAAAAAAAPMVNSVSGFHVAAQGPFSGPFSGSPTGNATTVPAPITTTSSSLAMGLPSPALLHQYSMPSMDQPPAQEPFMPAPNVGNGNVPLKPRPLAHLANAGPYAPQGLAALPPTPTTPTMPHAPAMVAAIPMQATGKAPRVRRPRKRSCMVPYILAPSSPTSPTMLHPNHPLYRHDDPAPTYVTVDDKTTRIWKCELCDKGFRRKADQIRHTRIHTGDKPYSCSVCGEAFARQDALRRHQNKNSKCSHGLSEPASDVAMGRPRGSGRAAKEAAEAQQQQQQLPQQPTVPSQLTDVPIVAPVPAALAAPAANFASAESVAEPAPATIQVPVMSPVTAQYPPQTFSSVPTTMDHPMTDTSAAPAPTSAMSVPVTIHHTYSYESSASFAPAPPAAL
ncbi:hypothetical protein, variant [Allomyces macrogynus ATCC 38327]|nr:hypothetical protein, variant [Allomyces macrogynus ATCC 38327]|eukprot:KNE62367.1 hypothetical protein, variant [Allomyces macrogynus ATCC 38327]